MALWEALRFGLIFRQESSYKFLHDRIQQAAYSQIPEEQRAEVHLRIGRRLITRQKLETLIHDLTLFPGHTSSSCGPNTE